VQEIKDSKYTTDSLAVDPNQNFIASLSEETIIQLHSLVDKKIIKLKLDNNASKICLSNDGNYLLVSLKDSKEIQAYQISKVPRKL
jgi:6-phosphogluconolactonase (cycloisomerase 2 family)